VINAILRRRIRSTATFVVLGAVTGFLTGLAASAFDQATVFWSGVRGTSVGDVRHRSLDADFQAERYLNALQRPPQRVMLVTRTVGNPRLLVAHRRDAIRQVGADQPLSDLRTMNDALRRSLQGPRVLFRTVAAFAVVALFLAMIGIYGVVAYSVRHRTREIGGRMALGASTRAVVRHIVRTGASPMVIGMAFVIVGAAWLGSLMEGIVFGISTTDPLTYIAVTGRRGLVSCAAPWTPV